MSDTSPILMWFRRDLRLSDHAALTAAAETGRPVIPVFIHDRLVEGMGAAPKWRLGLGLDCLAESLSAKGSRLILRRDSMSLKVLRDLVAETGAGAVYWTRLYDPETVARDTSIKEALKIDGIDARSFGGHLMFEPWTVETKTGGFYKVYTPYWNMVKTKGVDTPRPTPPKIATPETWPKSDQLEDWNMGAEMNRGADILRPFAQVGEHAAQDRLSHFCDEIIQNYKELRDFPSEDGTSLLAENLSLGEISPHQCWHAGARAMEEGKAGAEHFLKEVVWREFAYHLMHHTPHILDTGWREGWEKFPWSKDENTLEVIAWKQGRTGIPFVDAAMRELYVTGRMHNRARMIVASYLTKHLMTDWRIGKAWFEDCLVDWDPASNAMGWQWAAGSGPDASPYFRVFNPETQLDKFDKNRGYVNRFVAEAMENPHKDALAFFDAMPRSWDLSPDDAYPKPIVALDVGRNRALAAYKDRDF